MSKKNDNGIVYSTEQGRMCPGCGRAVGECVCGADESADAGDGVVRISRQTKGRGGKSVTVITGVPVTKSELKKLARELKARCGCGGTVKDDAIEIQGDKRDDLLEVLQAKGGEVSSGKDDPAASA
jgi:translation initiation factor 1